MIKQFLLACMAMGILAGGVYNDACATDQTEEMSVVESWLTREVAEWLVDGCKSDTLVIPEGYTRIVGNAFSDRKGFSSIVLPDSLLRIEVCAFWGCESLKSVIIPNNVRRICRGAFAFCPELTSITIPNSVTSIEYGAFSESNKAMFTVSSEAVKNYLSRVHEIGKDRIAVDTSLAKPEHSWKWSEDGNITVPSGTTCIGNHVFNGRSDIDFVELPDSVKQIGVRAFNECYGLEAIDLKNVTEVGSGAFRNCLWLTNINFPDNDATFGHGAFQGCERLRSVDLKNLKKIEPNMFSKCRGLKSIDMKNVTEIGVGAFEYTGLTKVMLPDGITEIRGFVFKGCKELTEITIPNNVTLIGKEAFASSGLTDVTIPNSVKLIEASAFRKCANLRSVTIPNSVVEIERFAFSECPELTRICVYSDRVKRLVLNSQSGIKPVKVRIIEEPKN